jgi:hypothetical protein
VPRPLAGARRRVLAVAAEVTDPDRLAGEQVEAANEVLNRGLGGKRNGYTVHAETSNQAQQGQGGHQIAQLCTAGMSGKSASRPN